MMAGIIEAENILAKSKNHMPDLILSDSTDTTRFSSKFLKRTNRRYGLWMIRKPLTFDHPYILRETRESYFLPTPFQREIGIRYRGQRPYRYPDSEGGYTGFSKRSNPKSIQELLKNLCSKKLARHRMHIFPGGSRHIAKSTGYALLWAPHLQLRSKHKYVRLIGTIRIFEPDNGD